MSPHNPSDHFIEVVGQPLFLQYRPNSLIRGQPADSLVWVAYDEFGAVSNRSTISVNIKCSPGYMIDPRARDSCLPCQPGFYNLPASQDQVSAFRRWVPGGEPLPRESATDRAALSKFKCFACRPSASPALPGPSAIQQP